MASIAEQEQDNPTSEVMIMPKFGEKQRSKNNKWRRRSKHSSTTPDSPINSLDDGCLMHIFSFLSPLPDRYNTALVCHRWRFLACHPRLWLRVDRTIKDLSEPNVFSSIDAAVSAAKPGETILISAGGVHITSNIQIKKPLCLARYLFFMIYRLDVCDFVHMQIGGGDLPEETTLLCSRSSDSALEFLSTCKITNLTVKAELGCCLLHRSGRLIIDSCILQCETDPLDYLSCPIVSTATKPKKLSSSLSSTSLGDGVTVSQTQIEGGARAVMTMGTLVLQRVRVIYGRTSVLYWFEVEHQW